METPSVVFERHLVIDSPGEWEALMVWYERRLIPVIELSTAHDEVPRFGVIDEGNTSKPSRTASGKPSNTSRNPSSTSSSTSSTSSSTSRPNSTSRPITSTNAR